MTFPPVRGGGKILFVCFTPHLFSRGPGRHPQCLYLPHKREHPRMQDGVTP